MTSRTGSAYFIPMRSFAGLSDYAFAFARGCRAPVSIAGVRWRPHAGHALVEYEFDARIGYSVPAREVRHDGCIADHAGRVYCPHCRGFVRGEP